MTACGIKAPNHNLNQCLLIISKVLCIYPGQFHRKCSRYRSVIWVWKWVIQDYRSPKSQWVNTITLEWNGHHFANVILNCILLWISLKWICDGAMVQLMAWHWRDVRPLHQPIITQFTIIYVPLGINELIWRYNFRVIAMELPLVYQKSIEKKRESIWDVRFRCQKRQSSENLSPQEKSWPRQMRGSYWTQCCPAPQ